MKKLTKRQRVQKEVSISFFVTSETKIRSSTFSQYFPSSSDSNASIRSSTSRTFISSVVITQKTVNEMFDEKSFVRMTLDAKRQNLERYKGWNILEQDALSDKTRDVEREKENYDEEIESREEDEEMTEINDRSNLGSDGDNDDNNNNNNNNNNNEIRLSDAMKKYYELPISLPANQYTETTIRSVAYVLKTNSDKKLNRVLTKEEILETISLCDYLGLKAFTK